MRLRLKNLKLEFNDLYTVKLVMIWFPKVCQ